MSAPVPLSSGCCAPPCSGGPQSAVPGPAGENAFAFTTANFTQPAVGANVVVGFSHAGWVVPGQVLFAQGGGYYQVISVSGLSVTLDNTGNTGNSIPGTVIAAGAEITPGGTGGTTGNAFTTTSANFTQPASSANVNVQVVTSAWAAVGQTVFVATGGYYTVFAIPDGTHLTLTNLGYTGNAAPTTVINSPQAVSPGGIQGAAGPSGVSTLNALSPTTTKGDIIADNGANAPLASDVRLAAGSNGKALVADSTQATGLRYAAITPNVAATSGDIAIFSGTSGTPMPLIDSKMLITTDGALQSTPSGGNARGTKAIDLQVDRALVTQVAGGNDSVISGGVQNTASGADSTVSGGGVNTASGVADTVSGGLNNTASGGSATVGGGTSNTASGATSTVGGGTTCSATQASATVAGGEQCVATATHATVAGGFGCQSTGQYASNGGGFANNADGDYSSAPGGQYGKAYLRGQLAHASGRFTVQGDAQASELIWRTVTVDATAGVEMFLDGAAIRAVVPLNTTWAFCVRLVGRSQAGVCAVWEIKGGIQNNANTVTLIAANTQAVIVDGTGTTWGVSGNVAVTADNGNKSLKIAVTGAGATNIGWVAHARLIEVSF